MPATIAVPKSKTSSLGSIALPIILALLGVGVAIGTILTWSSSSTDKDAISRQKHSVEQMTGYYINQIKREQAEMVIWENAAVAVASTPPDMKFIEPNLGLGAAEFFGHDQIFVLNPKLQPIYAMIEGGTVSTDHYEQVRASIEPFARRLQDINWRGAIGAYAAGLNEAPPSVGDIIMLGDRPAVLSLMPILSDKPNRYMAPGTEFIHVAAQYLDQDLSDKFADFLLLEDGHFTTQVQPDSGQTAVPIKNANGTPIAYYAWTPYQPSVTVFKRTLPVILFGVLLCASVIGFLTVRLRRSTKELERGRAEAQHLAYHDALTGLGNRVAFEISIGEAINSVKTNRKTSIALLLLDLDRFKQVNDTLGHEAGDELIREVGARLRPLVRENDKIVRLGGDEFGIVARDVTSHEDLAALSQRILVALRKPFDLRAGQAFVGVSIGISVTNKRDANPLEMTREADIALYEAKGGGRNQFCIFEEYMSEVLQERQTIEADLRAALRDKDQLDVAFAPLVRDIDNEMFGTAAEIVWNHPTRGNIPAEKFLPIAESCGLADIIGEFALLRACETGAKKPGQVMAVPTLPAQMRNPFFFDKLFSILSDTNMRPRDLELEVGEKVLSSTDEFTVSTLRKLRQAGVRIALDDFGTGFTSLQLLHELQVDRIKIDRAFIKELERSPAPEAITQAVIGLACAIGVEVSADGVDTLEQKQFLARMGCMSFQGDLFSPQGQAALLRATAFVADPPKQIGGPRNHTIEPPANGHHTATIGMSAASQR